MLAVARRFAVAYMPYQVGRLPRWARTAIERTCTPGVRALPARPAGAADARCRRRTRRRSRPTGSRASAGRGAGHGGGQLRLRAGPRRHRRVPAEAGQRARALAGRLAGGVSGGAPAVPVRAGADDPAAAAGGDARVPRRGRRIGGAMRDASLGAAGPVGGVPAADVPIFEGAAARFGLGARGPSILAAINYVESTFGTSNLAGVHSGTNSAGAAGPMQFLAGTWATRRQVQRARRPARTAAERLRRGRRRVQRRALPAGFRRAGRLAGRDLRLQPLERVRPAGPLAGAELLHPGSHRAGIRHLDDNLDATSGCGDRGQPVQRPAGERRSGRADHARARTADDRRRDRTSPTDRARGATT